MAVSVTAKRRFPWAEKSSSFFHFPTAKTRRAQREEAMNKTKEEIAQSAEPVVDAMLKVPRALGPGLLESTYQACLAHESTGTSL